MPLGRIVRVLVGEPGTQGRRLSSVRDDGRPGTSIDFRIEHARHNRPGRARLTMYNVSDETAAAFESTTAVVRVELGYQDEGTFVAFTGNPTPGGVNFVKRGPDRILEVEAEDGGRRYRIGRVSAAFDSQVPAQEVFDEIVKQSGFPVGRADLTTALPFVRGWAYSGTARGALDDLAGHTGFEWFLRDGAIWMLDPTKDTGERAVVFSSRDGNLVGSPSAVTVSGQGTTTIRGIEVHGLPTSGIRPGRPFRVESERYNGFYTAVEVSYRGSSYEGPYEVVVRGTPRR